MNIVKKYIRTWEGKLQDWHAHTNIKEVGGVNAVFFTGFCECNWLTIEPGNILDPEFGTGIEFEIEDMTGWMADYRCDECWCAPAFGTRPEDVPDDTQGFIYSKKDGTYGVILPVVSEEYKCVLAGGEDNKIIAKLFSWQEKLTACRALAFMWAEGDDPYAMLEKCAKEALALLGTGVRARDERRYPELFDYLGWCSWDAFHIEVSEDKLLSKCEEFKEKNIPVKWAILDDMWGDVRDFYDGYYSRISEMHRLMHSSRLYSFEADPKRFPNGLKGCIDRMKAYDLKVGMWHPTTGYWMGVDPRGPIFRDHRDCLIQGGEGKYVHSPEHEKAYRFYNAFHSYLRSCGAEFVKIDNQSMSRRFFKNRGPIGQTSRSYHDAMEASVGRNFDNQMINCMGMAAEDMWNRSVSPISRCSGDFQPENREWFARHILQCSYNSMIQGQFYYSDWDMWWTDDGQAIKNSVIRAVSGGPIYVSDTLDRSRRDVLMPLILDDGKILRCDRPGMPAPDCLVSDPRTSGKAFKIQNITGDSGVMACFNVDNDEQPVKSAISAADIPGLDADCYAVYEHFSGEVKMLNRGESFDITLKDGDEFKLFVFAPVKDGRAVIGRTDKFISPAAMRKLNNGNCEPIENGPWAYVENGKLITVE